MKVRRSTINHLQRPFVDSIQQWDWEDCEGNEGGRLDVYCAKFGLWHMWCSNPERVPVVLHNMSFLLEMIYHQDSWTEALRYFRALGISESRQLFDSVLQDAFAYTYVDGSPSTVENQFELHLMNIGYGWWMPYFIEFLQFAGFGRIAPQALATYQKARDQFKEYDEFEISILEAEYQNAKFMDADNVESLRRQIIDWYEAQPQTFDVVSYLLRLRADGMKFDGDYQSALQVYQDLINLYREEEDQDVYALFQVQYDMLSCRLSSASTTQRYQFLQEVQDLIGQATILEMPRYYHELQFHLCDCLLYGSSEEQRQIPQLLSASMAYFTQELGVNHPATLGILHRCALVLVQVKQFNEARRILMGKHVLVRETFGAQSGIYIASIRAQRFSAVALQDWDLLETLFMDRIQHLDDQVDRKEALRSLTLYLDDMWKSPLNHSQWEKVLDLHQHLYDHFVLHDLESHVPWRVRFRLTDTWIVRLVRMIGRFDFQLRQIQERMRDALIMTWPRFRTRKEGIDVLMYVIVRYPLFYLLIYALLQALSLFLE